MCEPYCAPLWCGPSKANPGDVYLCWRSGLFNKTSSHMWDNCYFPMFPLSDGSLTLTYMASLVVLAKLCASLMTMEKLFPVVMVTCGVGMVINGERCPKMFI